MAKVASVFQFLSSIGFGNKDLQLPAWPFFPCLPYLCCVLVHSLHEYISNNVHVASVYGVWSVEGCP